MQPAVRHGRTFTTSQFSFTCYDSNPERQNSHKMRRPTTLLFLLFFSVSAFAQISEFKVNNLSTDDGLPTDNILYIFQDSYGFLWMGSYEGLIRWDGYDYKRYDYDQSDSSSLSGNIVYTIHEDSKRRLWIGTIDGLSLYDRLKDEFIRCHIGKETTKIPVNDIQEDSQHQLWLGTSYGLCKYNYDAATAEWFVHDPKNENSLSHDVIFRMSIDSHDNLWIGTFEGGVNKFDPDTKTFTHFLHEQHNPSTICSNKIKSLVVDHQDHVWVGSYDKGVTLLDNNGKVLRHYRDFEGNIRRSNGPGDISCLYEDKNHTMWVGIKGQVLHYKEKDSDHFMPFRNTPYKRPGLDCVSVAAISEDSFGNLWFASQSHGLFKTNIHKNVFRHFYKGKMSDNSLSHNVVTSMHEDRNGDIWIGTDGGGLNLFQPDENKFTTFTTEDGLSSDAILDIQEDKDGNLWLATWSGGVMRFDPRTRKAQSFLHDPANPNSIILNNVKSLLANDTLIWIGTHGEGLSVYDVRNNRFINHNNNTVFPFNLKEPAWINHLFIDSRRRMWVSTYGGLFLYENGKRSHFTPSADPMSISSDFVNMVAEDHQGRIWVISESGGLDLYDEKRHGFIRYNEKYPLPATIKAITFDQNGIMWLTSNEGITRLDVDTGKSERYDQTDGLQGNSFFHKAVLASADGRLYFGGPNGINAFHPDTLDARKTDFDFALYLSDLSIYNTVQSPGHENSPLKKVLSFTDTLILNPEQSTFSIGFAALNFYSPSKTQYAYKLEGLHDEWINTGFENKVFFTRLDHGTYSFRVRYTDLEGNWHESAKHLHIVILPSWWQTWWFKLLVLAGIASLTIGLFYYRLSSIKRQNKLLEAEVAKRTHELSDANAYLIEKNEEIKLQNEKLEEYNGEILRQSEKILLQQEVNLAQNQQLEKTVQELHKSNQTKDRFFSILAHDLRNPVSALSGLAESLRQNLPALSRQNIQEYSESIYKASQSVYHLLINLLNWSRTQSQEIEYTPAEFDLGALISKNIALLEQQLQRKGIHINAAYRTRHKVLADYNMIDTVVRNLLSNSIKFTPANGAVEVLLTENDNEITVVVKDNGIGMTPGQLRNLFKIEKKFLSTGTAGETGTGLGLVICREFIEVNKGCIRVRSAEGKGSEFVFTLPKSKTVLPANRPPGDAVTPTLPIGEVSRFPVEKLLKIKGKQVLIIDDNKELRLYLRLNLSGIFEIFEAENGNQGLKVALEVQPTVIICDMMMPVMDGETFCRQIKQLPATSHIPVILLTSKPYDEGQLSGFEAGANAYLTKPAGKELLLQVIYNFIQAQEQMHRRILNSSHYYPDDIAINKVDEEFLNQVIRVTEAHLADPTFDYKLLCEETALSRTVLYAKVKTLTGLGVHEFIRSIRLKKSLQLLREGKLNVSQIALEVGFNSHSYFNKCFVKQYKVTPKDYAKSLQGAV